MSHGLNHPIRALLDADLRIIDAEPEIRRLHFRAGGGDDDAFALGAVANVARLCLKYRTRLSRQIRTSDGENALLLWVEANPAEEGVAIAITSWQQIVGGSPWPMGTLGAHAFGTDAPKADSANAILLQLDSALIVRGHSCSDPKLNSDFAVGQALNSLFIIEDDSDRPTPPLLSAVAERMPFMDKPITARTSRHAYRLSGQPLWDANRCFAGYACEFALDYKSPVPPSATVGAPFLASGNFARDLAPVLRQPVGRIIANAETISAKMQGALREGYADYAGDIANAARHLQSLIDDLTDLEAVERADFRPADDPIDLADVARRVAGLLGVKASDHQIQIDAPDEDVAAPAIGEFRRVLQIALNLVSNAIRYSPDGSRVTLTTTVEGDRAMLRVTDQGQGIAESDWDRIFAKFERLGRQDDGGSGLGLYISRRIATALQGRLLVEHSGAEGTTFLLDLPARI